MPMAQTTTYQYDSLGREIASIDAGGNKTTYVYDQYGNLASVTNPLGQVTSYKYDSQGNLTETIFPDGSSIEDSYDSEGRVTVDTDELGNSTQYVYNTFGDLIEEILPPVADADNGGAMTSPIYKYSYSNTGELLQVTDSLGNVTRYTYDPYGDQLSETLPDGETSYDSYNQYGELTQAIDFDGQVTGYVYNSLGQTTEKDYYQTVAQANSGTPSYSITYTYTALGQLLSVNDPRIGETTYQYNAAGMVTAIDSPEGTINYAYDPATNNLIQTYTDSTDIRYTYNVLGQLTSTTADELNGQTLGTPLVTTYTYTALGSTASETLPDGVTTTYVYDMNNNLVEEVNKDSSGNLLSEYQYVNDAAGNRVQALETTLQADGSLAQTKIIYKYDALGRVIEEQSQDLTGGQPQFNYTTNYTYDLAGNRISMVTLTSAGTTTTTYTYNGNDELLTAASSAGTVTTYSYDANGSLLLEQVNGQTVEQFTYNLENRLASATLYSTTSGGQSQVSNTQYFYDQNGNTVRTVSSVSTNGGPATTTATDYVIDEQNPSGLAQVLEARDGTTHAVTMTYILGDNIIAQVGHSLSSIRYFIYDGHGSTRLLLNSQGAITDRFAYTAFGNPIGFNPFTAATVYLYSGQQFDPLSGLYNMRARMYDPTTGRFTQADPQSGQTGDALSLHRYTYTWDDPVNLSDPSGYSPVSTLAETLDTLQKSIAGLALGALLIGAIPFIGPLAPYALAGEVAGIIGLVYSAVVTIEDVIAVTQELPYLYSLETTIGLVNPARKAAVHGIVAAALFTVVLDFTYLYVGYLLLVEADAFLGPFSGLLGFAFVALQIFTNAYYNVILAQNAESILTFSDHVTQTASNGHKIQYKVDAYFNQNADPVDVGKITKELWFGFNVGPWKILEYASDVIKDVASIENGNLSANTKAANLGAAVRDFYHVKTYLGGDFLQTSPAFGDMNVFINGVPIAPAAQNQSPAEEQVAPGSSEAGPLDPSDVLSTDDPRIMTVLAQATALWQAALGQPLPETPVVVVSALPAGVLAETLATSWNNKDQPTGYIIVVSPDADGRGWYLGSASSTASAFTQSPSASVLEAAPGSAAYGHYDLLTTLLHELGHVEGLMPGNPAFERYVQSIDGAQVFEAPGVTALLVDQDQELDFGGYPGDLIELDACAVSARAAITARRHNRSGHQCADCADCASRDPEQPRLDDDCYRSCARCPRCHARTKYFS